MRIAGTVRGLRRWADRRPLALRALSSLLFVVAYVALALVFAITMLPRLTDYEVRRVVSGSMEPNVGLNSLAITERVDPRSVEPGDVILFTAPNRNGGVFQRGNLNANPVLHRVIEVVDGGVRTKGDNNEGEDGWIVPQANIHGKLLFHVPWVGYALVFLSTQIGYFLCVVVPGFAIMIPELVIIGRWVMHKDITPPTPTPEPAA